MNAQNTGRGRGGFTMVELLVVIAIIALLMTILFPALAAGRESARSAVCTSNVRQLGLAAANRARDFDGEMTTGAWSNNPQLATTSPVTGGWVSDFVRGGYGKVGELLCPTNPATASAFYTQANCAPPDPLEDNFLPTEDALNDYVDRGHNTNYAASWYLAFTQTRSVRSSDPDFPGAANDVRKTHGPLKQNTVDRHPEISRIPLFGDGQPLGPSDFRINERVPIVAAAIGGIPHGTGLGMFDATPKVPNPLDDNGDPIVGRMFWGVGFGSFHSGDGTNIAFADGSAAKVPGMTELNRWEKLRWTSLGWSEKAEARVYGGWLITDGLRW